MSVINYVNLSHTEQYPWPRDTRNIVFCANLGLLITKARVCPTLVVVTMTARCPSGTTIQKLKKMRLYYL